MTISSDRVRRMLRRVCLELDALDRRKAPLTRRDLELLAALRIRRNLLADLLIARATERAKKIVSLARWRWGLAPRMMMLRYGPEGDVAAPDGARDLARSASPTALRHPGHRPGDEEGCDADDPLLPEAG